MPGRARHTEQARSTRPNLSKNITPRLITLPNPEVTREPDRLTIRIHSKTFNCTLDTVSYTYGYRLELRDGTGRPSRFNQPRKNADVTFAQRGEQVRQFGSLLQRRKDEFIKIPGMEKFPEMLDAMTKMDPKLNALSAELGQLRSLTKGVLPQNKHIQCGGNGDWLAFETLVQKAADMNFKG
ncbi:MAG: hypothetical protein Q9199_002742 [Rusavskia elegans]